MKTLRLKPEISIPEHLTGEIQSKLAYVDETITRATVHPDSIELIIDPSSLDDPDGLSPVKEAEITRKVHKIITSMAKGAIKPKIQVLEDHMDRPVSYNLDPNSELLRIGELSQEGNGFYTIGPLVSGVIDFFEEQFLNLADSINAKPYRFPTLISAEMLDRVGYFSAFPHSLSFVTHLREDLDVIDNFAQNTKFIPGGLNTSSESFARIQTLLSPAVCYHLYFSLADKQLPGGQLAATGVNNCFRYEAINLNSLERLWNFTMREIIFVGSKDYVLDNREAGRKRMQEFFDTIDFVYRVESANDPFFIGEFRKQAAFQSAFQLKFEIRASLPFKQETLAVGSYNYHQDFFGRNLNITLEDGSPAHTSCVAFGLERIAYAFLAQFGLDPVGWPEPVKVSVK
ncbi:MAG: hypothetical protein ACK2TW_08235 [Anaerolineales bacterium]|jgi:seryl-tRNA synthetase